LLPFPLLRLASLLLLLPPPPLLRSPACPRVLRLSLLLATRALLPPPFLVPLLLLPPQLLLPKRALASRLEVCLPLLRVVLGPGRALP
jgi:hypothetical protein